MIGREARIEDCLIVHSLAMERKRISLERSPTPPPNPTPTPPVHHHHITPTSILTAPPPLLPPSHCHPYHQHNPLSPAAAEQRQLCLGFQGTRFRV
mmetsp:Transcript_33839/g.82021  ORF Transcript_33839/g.82021 Transcript_33839/m.82021 type:complete len:96 (+) Transcript_33839:18-305(+)